ncbi:hypothetical protein DNTS_031831 [Danionella cerebrum]|uniref:BEN domain-containing protein n=1 Tax=Danionella cerebrum TaxID=2873325 RepID=A0A553NAI4_9TELE|nr:hypothetical protein DNTS_031831 [Danionella translucida]
MELAERKRSRKSPSFKLVSDADTRHLTNIMTENDTDGESPGSAESQVWLGDDGMEIKKQVTGMMHLLNDKTGRIYQRVAWDGESIKQEPQEDALSPPVNLPSDHLQYVWSSVFPLVHSQYRTHSRTQWMLNNSKEKDTALPRMPAAMETDSSCCMCNCKSTLQAILLELRTMRKLLQTQRGTEDKQCSCISRSPSRRSISRRRSQKWRLGQRGAVMTPHSKIARTSTPAEPVTVEECDQSVSYTVHSDVGVSDNSLSRSHSSSEPEVQLADNYKVFIPKAQLDSILLNYTRSGSLLFRKLVCAFFDDTTLANSLPNGKRKRGLNDTRKGLDQNTVGAIKVFTEKYCRTHGIVKLPGPRDWVQILQDQIKLARRRLKRGAADQKTNSLGALDTARDQMNL